MATGLRTIIQLVVIAAIVVSWLLPAATQAARPMTVASGTSGAPHAPEACTVAPRTIEELRSLAGSPVSSTSDPADVMIDEAVIDAVTATVNMSLACSNANKPLAAFALFTDHYLSQRFSGPGVDDLGHLEAALTRNPLPAPEADWIWLTSVENVSFSDDLRVVAMVTTENADGRFVDQLLFAWQRDQWLIDEIVSIDPPATPTSGEPVS